MGTRTLHRLSALDVMRAAVPGLYADGGGLYLQVASDVARSWVYRFMIGGRTREMGLGPLHVVSLAEARRTAAECRRLRQDGIDPIEARRGEREAARLEAAKAVTFKSCATSYIAKHKAAWRTDKHATQWGNTLAAYAFPVIGALPVASVDTMHMLKVLEPIWTAKPETAGRVRGRIEAILDWARVSGFRQGENPARLRGHLDKLLPAHSKVRKVKHHAALPFDETPAFIVALREQPGIAAKALEFLIVTAARPGEIIGAPWDEMDIAAKVWTVPAGRMKGGKEHRVPLSPRALSILAEMRAGRDAGEPYVFPGGKRNEPLSNNAMLSLLKRMGRSDVTAHGFRSSFRDWAAERTNHQNHVVEMALAHTVGDKVEAAYRRGDLFTKRRKLMDQWAVFCTTPKTVATVTRLQKA